MKNSKNSFACTLAAQIYNAKPGACTWSFAMKFAWSMVKESGSTFELVTAVKINGTVTRRVVSSNICEYYEVKGTGRPVKPGITLFVDLGKFAAEATSFIISFHDDKILDRSNIAA